MEFTILMSKLGVEPRLFCPSTIKKAWKFYSERGTEENYRRKRCVVSWRGMIGIKMGKLEKEN